jgi:hypothetical protein
MDMRIIIRTVSISPSIFSGFNTFKEFPSTDMFITILITNHKFSKMIISNLILHIDGTIPIGIKRFHYFSRDHSNIHTIPFTWTTWFTI